MENEIVIQDEETHKKKTIVSYPEDGSDTYFSLEDDSFWFRYRNRCIVKTIRSFPPKGSIYDIGGGNGYVAVGLQDAGFESVLVEPSKSGIDNARSRGLNKTIHATFDDSGIGENSIHAVGIFDVLEHIENDSEFLKTIYASLTTGGMLYITVPAFNMLWSAEDDHAGHFRRYTLKQIKNKLSEAGFNLCYSTYFFSLLTLPLFLTRSIPSKLGLRKVGNHKTYKREHNNMLSGIVESALGYELNQITKRTIPIGTSCMVVANK